MDALLLARLQFAFTIGYHILWPTFTIGVASFVAYLSFLWWRTGRIVYRDLMRFWIRIFSMGFGMGVITGLVLSYEIGTNWSGFSRSVSQVLSPLFAYEVMTAFFLEAGFIGIMLFGEGRVGRGMHFFACTMVAVGSLFSASWILAANSWMQTPAGAVLKDGIFYPVDWWEIVFNPSFPYRFLHMVCASYLTSGFVVAGVSAVHLLTRKHLDTAKIAFSMAMWAVAILAPVQILLGDLHGINTHEHQPIKVAAMEGLWETSQGASAVIFAWPDTANERNHLELSVPKLASLYLTHSWAGEVRGLKAVPESERPFVPVVFFAFRIMVGIGFILLFVAVAGLVLRRRNHLYDTRWFHIATIACTPLGFIAVLAGWTVTEVGRQPYVVYGALRTADAVSEVPAAAVVTSLVFFFIVYHVLLLAFFWFGARLVLRGPDYTQDPSDIHPGLDRSGPAVVPGHQPAPQASTSSRG